MKMKSLFVSLAFLLAMTAVGLAASLNQTVANINAEAKKDAAKTSQSVSKSTGVPVATIEKEKAKTGLSYGDIFAAHSIAKAAGKSFDDIAPAKKKGQTWDQIAEANRVSQGEPRSPGYVASRVSSSSF